MVNNSENDNDNQVNNTSGQATLYKSSPVTELPAQYYKPKPETEQGNEPNISKKPVEKDKKKPPATKATKTTKGKPKPESKTAKGKPQKGKEPKPETEEKVTIKVEGATKALEIKTSNQDIRFYIRFDFGAEEWNIQLMHKLSWIFPAVKSGNSVLEENNAKDKRIIDQLVKRCGIDKNGAEKLLFELYDTAGQHIDDIKAVLVKEVKEIIVKSPVSLQEKYSERIYTRAMEILTTGDPRKFYLENWKKSYAINGEDDSIGEMLLSVIASTNISNSKGIHNKINGPSGFGKSEAFYRASALFPLGKVYASSLSAKALYYTPLPAGTVIYFDDIDLSDVDFLTTIKQITSNYQSETNHTTVLNGKGVKFNAAPRIGIVLSAVDNFDDEQLDSRFGETEVKNDITTQKLIFEKQKEAERRKIKAGEVDEDTLVCRCMWDIIDNLGLCEIRIPFIDAIKFAHIHNPRNFPFFQDLIRCMALFKILQREKINNFYLATSEDFEEARIMYKKIERINATKLTSKEYNILKYLSDQSKNSIFGTKVSRMDLVEHLSENYGMKQNNIIDIIHGKKNSSGGLLNKVAGLQAEKLHQDSYTMVWYYWYPGGLTDNGYAESILLDEDRLEETVNKWQANLT